MSSQATITREPEPKAPSSCARKYLYAIIPEGSPPAALAGIDGAAVETISAGSLTAVVSTLSAQSLRPERRHLAAHQQVLKELLARTTVLPVSFGVVAAGDDAIRRMLVRAQRTLRAQLRRVAGKVEMGLRAVWDVPNIFEYFVNTHSELRAARDRLLGGGQEPSQEDKIELGMLFDRLLGEDRETYAEQVRQVLAPVTAEIKTNPCRNEREVMNLACLVARDAQEQFASAVFEAARLFDNNFALDYNGPWAPHNFVQANLAP